MTTLLAAHRQWANRPADERFFDLTEMRVVAQEMKNQGKEVPAALGTVRVEVQDEDLVVVGRQGQAAQVSHLAFSQLAGDIGAPAGYLRTLPATLAAQNLNHGLKKIEIAKDAEGNIKADSRLLLNSNGSNVLRALTSQGYKRLWNVDLIDRLMNELPASFRTPRARPSGIAGERTRVATEADVMPGSLIQIGETIAPAGCYLGDKDMFLLVIDTTHPIDDGTESPLQKGFMLWNSEVGTRAIGGMFFSFKEACGNHIVWGAENVLQFEHRHVGNVATRVADSMGGFALTLKAYAESSVSDEEAQIKAARTTIIGQDKDAVIDAVVAFAKSSKIDRLTRTLVTAGYDAAVEHEAWYGNPHSVYGMLNGVTEAAQDTAKNFDERHAIDTAAGRLLDMSKIF